MRGDSWRSIRHRPTPGRYDVYPWYPQGSNRTTNAPVLVSYSGGSVLVRINQTTNGGGWRLIASEKEFAAGTNGFVRLSNDTGESSKVVMADAFRWLYSASQEPPPPGTVPIWWASFYFGTNVNALLDHDGDGYDTATEYILGTDPTAAASRLEFGLTEGTNGIVLAFRPMHAGRVYRLQCRTNLAASGWTALPDSPSSPNGIGEGVFTLTNNPAAQSYYRLAITLSP